MYKFDGLLIYQSHDDQGIIEIVDQGGIRALHFGSSSQQSSMNLSEPNQLHALYSQAMMAGLMFNDNPQKVLMIGLGGGSIAKFLLHEFPDCRIKAVEFRNGVLKVARSHFGLPLDQRLKVKIGCGAQHVYQESREHSELYDMIVIDAYDADGMSPEISSESFFDHCHTLLTPQGMLIINLWGTDKPLFEQVNWHLNHIFQYRTLNLPVRNRGNVIGFAFGSSVSRINFSDLITKAQQLEQRYHLDFSGFLLEIKRHNAATLKRIFQT